MVQWLIAGIASGIMLSFPFRNYKKLREGQRDGEIDQLFDDMFSKIGSLANDPLGNKKELEELVPISQEVDKIYQHHFPNRRIKRLADSIRGLVAQSDD